jgi:sterol desaturase/sphingolipid hydroxylase (fatty acid hydroxylase superfamily)
MTSFNPACYLPSAVNQYLHHSVACAPPPSYLSSAYNILTSSFSSTYAAFRTTMDVLASLPMLSFLLIPTMSSYSTSLNILFFYLTWSTLVLSHPPLQVEIVGTLAIRTLFYLLPSTFFLFFDSFLPSAAQGLKATGVLGLPFHKASRKRTLRVLRMICWSLGNVLLSVLAQVAIEIMLVRVLAFRPALKVTTSLPMPWPILKDLLLGYLAREVIGYILHRYLLHEGSTQLVDYHSDWYHSISSPFPLSATYDHPVTHLIHSFLPTFLPAMIFRFHLLTYLLYLSLISIEETFAYSGYNTVPTNFILGGVARRTDNHVLCGGEGNFGSWGLVDWIMGTSVGGDLMEDVVVEVDEHDVQGRMKRKGKTVSDKIREKVEKKMNGGGRANNGRRRRRRDS